MRIIETNIPDVTKENIDHNKMIITENIIKNIYPLFDEVLRARSNDVSVSKKKIKEGRQKLQQEKDTMQQLVNEYKKEQKISKILERIDKLVKSGLAYDSQLKHEMVILLKIIDKLPNDKLDQQLAKTMQILNKRFSQ